MSKPLGYYTDNTQPEVAKLEAEHGSYLQGMTEDEKLTLLVDTVNNLQSNNSQSNQNQIGLVKAIAENL